MYWGMCMYVRNIPATMDDYQTHRKILSQKHSTIVNSNDYIDLLYINK